jgi:membrane associated rhomboid family serine protease
MLDELATSFYIIKIQIQNNLPTLGLILLVPWCFFLFSSFISKNILLLGIIPRRLIGLPGIIFAPLLHADFNHIFFNSIPLFVLSGFILLNGFEYYLMVTALITLMSGLAIWCFAKNGLHVGASALITGYWSFILVNVYQHTSPITIILGLLSLYYFAGIFFGIFPREKGVSWQGHLFGLLAGIATSYLLK